MTSSGAEPDVLKNMEVFALGALQGTLTYKLFYVDGELDDDFKKNLVEQVNHRAFQVLEPEDEDEERYGWVPIENPLNIEFDLYNILFDHFINLGLRHDKWSVPSNLLKAHVSQAEREYMADNDKERLSKFEKEDIKAMVHKKLRERSLPRMKVIDMSWDIQSGRVRFWNQSDKTCELFQGLFEDTFGLKLLPANPYINAIKLDLTPDELTELPEVQPTDFVGATATT